MIFQNQFILLNHLNQNHNCLVINTTRYSYINGYVIT